MKPLDPLQLLDPLVWMVYPSKALEIKIVGLFNASLRAHSVLICLNVAKAAVALDFLIKQLKLGIAIALNTDKTATTTTNSIRENPSSSFFFLEKIFKKQKINYAIHFLAVFYAAVYKNKYFISD